MDECGGIVSDAEKTNNLRMEQLARSASFAMYSSIKLCGHFFSVRGSCSRCYDMNCVCSFMIGYSMPVRGRFSIFLLGMAGVAFPRRLLVWWPRYMLKGTELFLWLALF